MSAPGGAASVSELSSSVPRLTAMVLPSRSAGPFTFDRLRPHHRDVVGRVGVGEVDHLLALGALPDAEQDIDSVLGQIGNAVLAGDADELDLDFEGLSARICATSIS